MYNLNLLPPKMRKKHKKKIKFDNPTYGVFLLGFIIVICFITSSMFSNNKKDLTNEKKDIENQIYSLIPQYSTLTPVTVDNTYYEALKKKVEELNNMLNNSIPWYLVLDAISATTPSDVTILSIKDNGNNSLTIQAQTSTMTSMATMVENLENNDDFSNTSLDSYTFNQSTYINRESYSVSFSITTSYGDVPIESITNLNTNSSTENIIQNNQVYYKTDTGEKYHVDGCKYLNNSKEQITSQEELDKLEPCSECID